MRPIDYFKLFISSPFSILRKGLNGQIDVKCQQDVSTRYGIASLPVIDIKKIVARNQAIRKYSFLDGTSMVTDIILLKSLAARFEKCKYLEIGSWRGESLANVADVADHCISITLGEKEMLRLNYDDKVIALHGFFSRDLPNVNTIFADSQNFDFSNLDEKFDLAFIDGDHRYESIVSDTKNVLEVLRDRKSIIVWHDYGWNPEKVRFSTLKAILEAIPSEDHQFLYHVSNTKCAVFIREDFETMKLASSNTPKTNFNISIDLENI